jgi:hypothetical protein
MTQRPRITYIVLLVVTIAAGLASRGWDAALPVFISRYAGDTLWASMVVWLLAIVWPRASTAWLASVALAIAVADELSQLYHAEWIDQIRATRPGALVLGQGFLWSDLVCYIVGVGLAASIDGWIVGRTRANVRK